VLNNLFRAGSKAKALLRNREQFFIIRNFVDASECADVVLTRVHEGKVFLPNVEWTWGTNFPEMGGKVAPLERISKISRESWRKLFLWPLPRFVFSYESI
jgi:hypothetical protein